MNNNQLIFGLTWNWLGLSLALMTFPAWPGLAENSSPCERINFDDGWRFTKGDAPNVGDALNYDKIKDWLLPTSTALSTKRGGAAVLSFLGLFFRI